MIDSEQKLSAFLLKLKTAEWVALDTEADSLHAYPEKLCLVQLSIEGMDVLLDPLSRMDYKPVLEVLQKQELIMHGADYDLRLLRRHFGFVPDAIFDTMLAGRLLGMREFGLNNLVSKFLGVKLEKGPQKANWARRPLTARMESYARNDTHYLKPLSDMLRAELEQKGRLKWHREACSRLIADCAVFHPPDPEEVWRVKGSQLLGPGELAVLRELWHWREHEAIRTNRPPFFILTPEIMVRLSIAARDSQPVKDLLSPNWSAHRREGILNAIAKGMAVEKLPVRPPRRMAYRQTEPERRRMLELQKRRNRHAGELGIDPTLIASRATLVLLAKDFETYQKDLMSWQRELLTDTRKPATATAG